MTDQHGHGVGKWASRWRTDGDNPNGVTEILPEKFRRTMPKSADKKKNKNRPSRNTPTRAQVAPSAYVEILVDRDNGLIELMGP